MGGKSKDYKRQGLIIEYRELGTVSVEEMVHALIEDLHALRDIYNVRYTTGAHLRLPVTNEYGEHLTVRGPSGGHVFRLDTHHYQPACKDYDL